MGSQRQPIDDHELEGPAGAPEAGDDDRHPEGGRPVGEESEALKADIERRRQSMTKTIDAIEHKVVPARVIERQKTAVSGWASERSRTLVAGVAVVGVAALVAVSIMVRLRSRSSGE